LILSVGRFGFAAAFADEDDGGDDITDEQYGEGWRELG